MKEIEADGILKTIDGSMLEQYTSQGYRVIGSYQDTIAKRFAELIDAPPNSYGHGYQDACYYTDESGARWPVPPGKTIATRFVSESKTFFVVRRNEESALAELRKNVEALSQSEAASRAKAEAVTKEHEKTKAELSAARSDLERSQGKATRLEREAHEERTLRRKLEVDLAKVRKAIGDLKYNEILAMRTD